MNGCAPFTPEELDSVLAAFVGPERDRNRGLLLVGCNTGYRISEILSLRVRDVLTDAGEVVDLVRVTRKNTKGKHQSRTVVMNKVARRGMDLVLDYNERRGRLNENHFVFQSRTGEALTRKAAYGIIHRAARRAGVQGKIGTHSMRKTFAKRFYSRCLELIGEGHGIDAMRETQMALGHAAITSTEKYLDFRNELQSEIIFELGEVA